jgi:hypothetical protein
MSFMPHLWRVGFFLLASGVFGFHENMARGDTSLLRVMVFWIILKKVRTI